jgi:hypothetical protein
MSPTSRSQTLTLSSLLDLASVDGAYILAYSFLFGMSIWVNFFGGVIAYRALRTWSYTVIVRYYLLTT